MTTYNTGNPVGSVDVRDLYDNAENFDNFSNGAALAYTDRKGVSRQSLAGIRAASQYTNIGAYAAGLVFTSYNQTFSYAGEFYAPSAGLTLPYTTTGVGAAEIATFRSVGDAILRADLANSTDPAKGASLVGHSGRTLSAKLLDMVSVKDFGATGNGIVDDTNSIVSAIAFLASIGGGTLNFPNGTYRVTDVIDVPSNIIIVGSGRRKAYSPQFVPSATCLATIWPDHSGRCCFRIYNVSVDAGSNVQWRDINIATNGTAGSSGPTAAIGFALGQGNFQRDFSLDRVGIHGFTSAIDSYKTGVGVNTQVGVIKIVNCAISLNAWIARTLDGTQWNGFTFLNNEAGQNGYEVGTGGIAITAINASIENNILEGMRDAVLVSGSVRGIKISGNYFEANIGNACIQLKDVRGKWFIGANSYNAINYVNLGNQVLLGTGCGPGLCLDPYWPELVHKTPPAVLGADAATGDNILNPNTNIAFARADVVSGFNYSQPPLSSSIVTQPVTSIAREVNPMTGQAMAVQSHVTAGAGLVPLTYAISGASGSWVAASWLVKHITGGANFDPYISISINGVGAAGSRDIPISKFSANWINSEWCLITFATKIGVAMTSLGLTLFPYGLSPDAGRESRFLRPVVYVTDSPSKLIPYINNFVAQSIDSAPTTGNWVVGDRLWRSPPGIAGQTEFVCTASGSPGAWGYA